MANNMADKVALRDSMRNEREKDLAIEVAVWDYSFQRAVKYTAVAAAASTAGVLLAVAKSPKFKALSTVSIRTSIPAMVTLATFSLTFELTQYFARIAPEEYGIVQASASADKPVRVALPFYKRALNHVYDHPFQMIVGMGVPLAGSILYAQMGKSHLSLSQKIMHSRVYAQGGVLTILVVTMGTMNMMKRRGGKFVEAEIVATP